MTCDTFQKHSGLDKNSLQLNYHYFFHPLILIECKHLKFNAQVLGVYDLKWTVRNGITIANGPYITRCVSHQPKELIFIWSMLNVNNMSCIRASKNVIPVGVFDIIHI